MTALAIAAGSNRLPVLASSINEHLVAAEAATRRGLEHAIAAGLLLIEAKELVEHGEWLPWLQANCPHISPRQAQTYMRLARHRDRLDAVKNAATAHLTIAAAEALVGRPRPERPHGLPGQLDLLGGPEVTASSPATSGTNCDLIDSIMAAEFALAVIEQAQRVRSARGKRLESRLPAAISAVAHVLKYLQYLRRQSAP
jgi:hypothetical protein